MRDDLDRGFCWRCLFFALGPLFAAIALGWLVIDQLEEGRAEAALDVDAMFEEMADLETENADLRADVGGLRENLRVARAAVAASGGAVDDLVAQIRALPSAERLALLEEAERGAPATPEQLTQRIGAASPDVQGLVFDTLPALSPFAAWFSGLDPDARAAWLRQLPGGDVLVSAAVDVPGLGELDVAEASERIVALRDALGEATAEVETLRGAEAALLDERERLRGERDEQAAELSVFRAATADSARAQLALLDTRERALFFAGLPRSEALGAWVADSAVEEREAFAATLPDALKTELATVTLESGEQLSADDVRTRVTDLEGALDETLASLEIVAGDGGADAEITRLNDALEGAELRVQGLEAQLEQAQAALEDAAQASVPETGDAASTAPEAQSDPAASADGDGGSGAERGMIARLEAALFESERARLAAEEAFRESEAARADVERIAADKEAALRQSLNAAEAARDAASAGLSAAEQDAAAARAALRADVTERLRAGVGTDARSAAAEPAPEGAAPAGVALSANVAFESASARLSPAGRQALDRVAAQLLGALEADPAGDWRLQIVGHTDKLPINTAEFPSNWELSAARAAAVARHLTGAGVPPDRLVAVGRADREPLDLRETPAAFARNRRIEFRVVD